MTRNDYKIGGFIKVVKDGIWKGKPYKIGEIGKIVAHFENHHIDVTLDNGITTRLCVVDNSPWNYGIECEFLGMEHPNEDKTYQIY